MMQKVENRSLLVTTDVPGHHRPILTKQLKCQSLHCGTSPVTPNWLGFRPAKTDFGCGKAARGGSLGRGVNGLAKALTKPDYTAFAGGLTVPIKAAPLAGNSQQESQTRPQPWRRLKR
jgi:hypothetical protein